MLSYQHLFHAGNLADVHKHALLAWILAYLLKKPKPISYIETHAGRGLYDLGSEAALKTGEAQQGIEKVRGLGWFPADHPYLRCLKAAEAAHGASHYPGSPLIAAQLLRDQDRMHLAELHPQEYAALRRAVGKRARLYQSDGLDLAQSLCPPEPRRGMLLIDPSFEVKADYAAIARLLPKLHQKWNVGVIALWYPILRSGAQAGMVAALTKAVPEALNHQVRFPPAREGHGMIGSGMFVINPPWGLEQEAKRLSARFAGLGS